MAPPGPTPSRPCPSGTAPPHRQRRGRSPRSSYSRVQLQRRQHQPSHQQVKTLPRHHLHHRSDDAIIEIGIGKAPPGAALAQCCSASSPAAGLRPAESDSPARPRCYEVCDSNCRSVTGTVRMRRIAQASSPDTSTHRHRDRAALPRPAASPRSPRPALKSRPPALASRASAAAAAPSRRGRTPRLNHHALPVGDHHHQPGHFGRGRGLPAAISASGAAAAGTARHRANNRRSIRQSPPDHRIALRRTDRRPPPRPIRPHV